MSVRVEVLFVCLGNICRSPTAEGVFGEVVKEAGLDGRIVIDSAGTGGWHAGEPADARMQRAAKRRGYTLTSRARQVDGEDFRRFDHIYAMDHENRQDLLRICPKGLEHKVELFRDYDPKGRGEAVPDPYYGGDRGFEEVLDIVERTSRALLVVLRKEHEL